ncbi:MAG TPA: sigma-70 family RNA polymerase sigma factor [Nitrospiria bacterium]
MNQDAEKDWEWVRKVQSGDTDSFEALVLKYEKRTFNILYRWLGDYDEAAEAAQEVFLSAYRGIRNFRGDSSFSTWLYRITINQGKNIRQKLSTAGRRRGELKGPDPEHDGDLLDTLPHPGPNPSQEAERRETRKAVEEGIERLGNDEAIILILHDIQELSYEDVSGILKIPLGTVKSRLHRARMALKDKLASLMDKKEIKH